MAAAATDAYNASLQLLACLQIAVEAAANPPRNVQFLPGAQAAEDLSEFRDLCCEGTAYVRVATIYPSFQEFPAPDTQATPCQQQAVAVTYELGIMRCAPTGTAVQIPTSAEWAAAHQQQMIDAQSMFKAACCFQGVYRLDTMLVGAWSPGGPSGGCLIGTMSITHSIVGCGGIC